MPPYNNTYRVHRQRRTLQSHVVELCLLSSSRNNSLADRSQSQFAQNKRLVRKANAMRWINYECSNEQWTHASHAIMTQQRHNALASHGFSTRWCPSAGHRALHGPMSTIMHNFGIQMCQSAGHTIYKYTMMSQSNTTKLYYVYYCIRATCLDFYRIIFRSFWDTDPYVALFKLRCGIPNAYILDITMYNITTHAFDT